MFFPCTERSKRLKLVVLDKRSSPRNTQQQIVMKKVLGIFLAIILMPAAQVQAWIGGPFSNNSHFVNGDDGIYEAYATVQNGTGLFRFAVRNNGVSSEGTVGGINPSNVDFGGILTSSSINIWYYRGITYVGNTIGMANSDLGIVSATGNAVAGNNVFNNTNYFGPSGNNVGFANSTWTARIKQKFPIVRFNGSGTVSFLGQVDTVVETRTLTTTTVPSGTTVNTTVTSSGGESDLFKQRGSARRFLVYGTRVTTQVLP